MASQSANGTQDLLIVRLWDAFADLLAGRLVDRTMTRWGKFRPFIIFGAMPLLFMRLSRLLRYPRASTGYIAASATNPSPVQPASAIFAIKATIGLLPALAALIAMIIFIKYPPER